MENGSIFIYVCFATLQQYGRFIFAWC